jgi:3'-phosphoadenosine 5'-phosphosulfate sulfotransferase (PAPS reductase)/FAD synthetase
MMRRIDMSEIVSWWSGGITSAVACFLVPEARPIFIETGSHHPDNLRFKTDCERWYGKTIETLQNTKYSNHFDVVKKTRFINGPRGARCTTELKKKVRIAWEKDKQDLTYVWGFEASTREEKRANQIIQTVPNARHLFPLLEQNIDKKQAIQMVLDAGIEIPAMYRLGFQNNNCIGCVKGGAAYWNLIRREFPEYFAKMAQLELEIGRSCLKKTLLCDLNPNAGRGKPPLVMDCGSVGEGCEIQTSIAYFNFLNQEPDEEVEKHGRD